MRFLHPIWYDHAARHFAGIFAEVVDGTSALARTGKEQVSALISTQKSDRARRPDRLACLGEMRSGKDPESDYIRDGREYLAVGTNFDFSSIEDRGMTSSCRAGTFGILLSLVMAMAPGISLAEESAAKPKNVEESEASSAKAKSDSDQANGSGEVKASGDQNSAPNGTTGTTSAPKEQTAAASDDEREGGGSAPATKASSTPGTSSDKAADTSKSDAKQAAPDLPVTLDSAGKLYTKGKYREALAILAKLKPNEQTHYYTAMCYQALGQFKQAAIEFKWVASNAKNATLIKYAQNALLSLDRATNVRGPGATPQTSNPVATTRPAVYQGNNPIKREQRTTDSSEIMIGRRGHFR